MKHRVWIKRANLEAIAALVIFSAAAGGSTPPGRSKSCPDPAGLRPAPDEMAKTVHVCAETWIQLFHSRGEFIQAGGQEAGAPPCFFVSGF